MRRLWSWFVLWNANYCFEHKEFSCVACWKNKTAKHLKKYYGEQQ